MTDLVGAPGVTTQVVLLRGINVGGNHRLPMAQARELLTDAGFGQVRSYIQSGNVLVDSPWEPRKTARRVRALLEAEAGFPVPTVVLTAGQLRRVLAANPFSPSAGKLEHVVLLAEGPDDELRGRLEALAAADATDDGLVVGEGCVYLHHPRGLSSSTLAKRATALLKQGTARNLATLQALAALLDEHPGAP